MQVDSARTLSPDNPWGLVTFRIPPEEMLSPVSDAGSVTFEVVDGCAWGAHYPWLKSCSHEMQEDMTRMILEHVALSRASGYLPAGSPPILET